MIGIYKITNKINGKIYIGKSIHIFKRFKEHTTSKLISPLYHAFRKYNIINFTFEIIHLCEKCELDIYENYYIDYFNCLTPFGYNLFYNDETNTKIISEETKLRMSESHKGHIHSKEHKEKISKSLIGNKYNLGNKHTEETKEKMRVYASKPRKPLSEEHKKKLSDIAKNRNNNKK